MYFKEIVENEKCLVFLFFTLCVLGICIIIALDAWLVQVLKIIIIMEEQCYFTYVLLLMLLIRSLFEFYLLVFKSTV